MCNDVKKWLSRLLLLYSNIYFVFLYLFLLYFIIVSLVHVVVLSTDIGVVSGLFHSFVY